MKRGSGGVRVLGVLFVDLERGLIELEWIEGMTARKILGGGDEEELPEQESAGDDEDDHLQLFGIEEGMSAFVKFCRSY